MAVRMFERNPLVIEAIQWLGDNEAQVRELAGNLFTGVKACTEGEDCQTCVAHSEITAELTLQLGEEDSYTQGMETGWWVVRTPAGQITMLSDSTLRANYTEIVYAGSD